MERGNSFGLKSSIAKYAKGPMGLWNTASRCVSVILTLVVYVFVCMKAWGGAFGVGLITQYVGAITNMFLGISLLLETMGDIRANSGFLDNCFEFLDIPNKMYQGSLTTEKRRDRNYQVEFRDVSFKYPGTDVWALRHVNIKFKVGNRLAVVGMNGSGKTTFIKLLCRLYDPTEGEILLNGIDIRKYRYDDYINIFSVVFQDFKLLSLPIGENVSDSTCYDTKKVEECLKNAPFIILDEPKAALDPIAEAEIYSRFNDIAGDKTAIYISHRLSSCKFCDEIAVFHEGAVIQQGSHDELVKQTDGKYYELWTAQAQYYQERALN